MNKLMQKPTEYTLSAHNSLFRDKFGQFVKNMGRKNSRTRELGVRVKFGILIFILLSSLTLVSCSTPQEEPISENKPTLEEQEALEEKEPTREAVYIHNNDNSNNPPIQDNIIILNIGGEPLQLNTGYIRLVGTVCRGGTSYALLELSGQGLSVKRGEKIAEYFVSSIKEREVKLCLRK